MDAPITSQPTRLWYNVGQRSDSAQYSQMGQYESRDGKMYYVPSQTESQIAADYQNEQPYNMQWQSGSAENTMHKTLFNEGFTSNTSLTKQNFEGSYSTQISTAGVSKLPVRFSHPILNAGIDTKEQSMTVYDLDQNTIPTGTNNTMYLEGGATLREQHYEMQTPEGGYPVYPQGLFQQQTVTTQMGQMNSQMQNQLVEYQGPPQLQMMPVHQLEAQQLAMLQQKQAQFQQARFEQARAMEDARALKAATQYAQVQAANQAKQIAAYQQQHNMFVNNGIVTHFSKDLTPIGMNGRYMQHAQFFQKTYGDNPYARQYYEMENQKQALGQAKRVYDSRRNMENANEVEVVEVPFEVVRYVNKDGQMTEETHQTSSSTIKTTKSNKLALPQISSHHQYDIETKVIQPVYEDIDVPLIVSESVQPEIEESQNIVEVEVYKYVPEVEIVDIYVPRPVAVPIKNTGVVKQEQVPVTAISEEHLKSTLLQMNPHIQDLESFNEKQHQLHNRMLDDVGKSVKKIEYDAAEKIKDKNFSVDTETYNTVIGTQETGADSYNFVAAEESVGEVPSAEPVENYNYVGGADAEEYQDEDAFDQQEAYKLEAQQQWDMANDYYADDADSENEESGQ